MRLYGDCYNFNCEDDSSNNGERLYLEKISRYYYSCPKCLNRRIKPISFQEQEQLQCKYCGWIDYADAFLEKTLNVVLHLDNREYTLIPEVIDEINKRFCVLDKEGNEVWFKEVEGKAYLLPPLRFK